MLEACRSWLEEHERSALGALISFYLAIVVAQANLKLLWTDELFTFYISQQPGLGGVWRALVDGADPNPPLMHVLVKWSTALLGGSALAMRLPAILCVLLAIMAMWWMLRRWVRPVFAMAGVLAFMATRGFDYAYDARSYAPMIGFAMASLALWMAATDLAGWRRGVALAGMAIALALGISSNYYCVLAFFPIAIGELVARRWRPGVWLAMTVASLPLIAYLPLIRHDIGEFGPYAWNRTQTSVLTSSYFELVEGIFWPVLGLGLWAIWKARTNTGAERTDASPSTAEMAAVGVLLVYPFLGFAIAVSKAGMISPRCVAPVCCGFGMALGLLGQRIFRGSGRAGMALVFGLVFWVGVRESVCAEVLWKQREAFLTLVSAVESVPADRVIVGDSGFMLPFFFYANGSARQRVVFPVDFPAIHRYEREDSGEQNLWAGGKPIVPFPVTTLDDALSGSPAMVVVGRPHGWLAESMRLRGFTLQVTGDRTNWGQVGGIFSPMAHPRSRMMVATLAGR